MNASLQPNYFLITGASSGIGKALAIELAKREIPLCLVARDTDRLEATRLECLQTSPNLAICVVTQDLLDPQASRKIIEKLEGKRLQGIALNAGVGLHGDFLKTELSRNIELVTLQVRSTIELCHSLLPLIDGTQPHYLLFVSSVYAFTPVPYQAAYSASKAFMNSFAESLAFELRETKIQISILCPGSTRTEFRKRAGIHEAKGGDPAEVAAAAIEGLFKNQRVIIPGFVNRIFVKLIRLLSGDLAAKVMWRINQKRGVNKL